MGTASDKCPALFTAQAHEPGIPLDQQREVGHHTVWESPAALRAHACLTGTSPSHLVHSLTSRREVDLLTAQTQVSHLHWYESRVLAAADVRCAARTQVRLPPALITSHAHLQQLMFDV